MFFYAFDIFSKHLITICYFRHYNLESVTYFMFVNLLSSFDFFYLSVTDVSIWSCHLAVAYLRCL